jgi:hypothetical protein
LQNAIGPSIAKSSLAETATGCRVGKKARFNQIDPLTSSPAVLGARRSGWPDKPGQRFDAGATALHDLRHCGACLDAFENASISNIQA